MYYQRTEGVVCSPLEQNHQGERKGRSLLLTQTLYVRHLQHRQKDERSDQLVYHQKIKSYAKLWMNYLKM